MVIFAPERGDVVWLNFEPQKGRVIQKTRPAVVLSPSKYNVKSGLALFAPICSQIKNYPFEIIINYMQINGVVLCHQVRAMDWQARKATKILSLDKNIMETILSKIKLLL